MSQPVQNAGPIDPAVIAAYIQNLAASGQLPGYTLVKEPDPVQPLTLGELLRTIVSRIPWHTEEIHNTVHAAAENFVREYEQLRDDLTHIRARLGLYEQPLTPPQQQVLAGAGVAVPQQPAQQPAAPVQVAVQPNVPAPQVPQVPQVPQLWSGYVTPPANTPGTATVPPPVQFGPAGVPVPPPPAAPPAPTAPPFALFNPSGVPFVPPAPPAAGAAG